MNKNIIGFDFNLQKYHHYVYQSTKNCNGGYVSVLTYK